MTAVARRGYALALGSLALASAAQLLLKLGMARLPPLAALLDPALWLTLDPLGVAGTAAGVACYGLSMVIWINVLTLLPLAVPYPLLSLSYVIVYLVATQVPAWGEAASDRRTAGILLIMLGVALVSRPGAAGHGPGRRRDRA